MAETKTRALQAVTLACHRCCGLITMGLNGLECSLGKDRGHHWEPPKSCPIPKLYERVEREKVDPADVTPEYVEERRPKHDGHGHWLKEGGE